LKVLDMFAASFNVGWLNENGEAGHGDRMQPMRRPDNVGNGDQTTGGVHGFRETRSQAGYCPTCRLSVPIENHATRRPATAINGRLRPGLSGFLSMWLRVTPARSGGVEWV
jgi:hypothetical protein